MVRWAHEALAGGLCAVCLPASISAHPHPPTRAPSQALASYTGRLAPRLALLSPELLDRHVVQRVLRWAGMGDPANAGDCGGAGLGAMLAEDALEVRVRLACAGRQGLQSSCRCRVGHAARQAGQRSPTPEVLAPAGGARAEHADGRDAGGAGCARGGWGAGCGGERRWGRGAGRGAAGRGARDVRGCASCTVTGNSRCEPWCVTYQGACATQPGAVELRLPLHARACWRAGGGSMRLPDETESG